MSSREMAGEFQGNGWPISVEEILQADHCLPLPGSIQSVDLPGSFLNF